MGMKFEECFFLNKKNKRHLLALEKQGVEVRSATRYSL